MVKANFCPLNPVFDSLFDLLLAQVHAPGS